MAAASLMISIHVMNQIQSHGGWELHKYYYTLVIVYKMVPTSPSLIWRIDVLVIINRKIFGDQSNYLRMGVGGRRGPVQTIYFYQLR